jgi:hypothetical protein
MMTLHEQLLVVSNLTAKLAEQTKENEIQGGKTLYVKDSYPPLIKEIGSLLVLLGQVKLVG